MIEAVGDGVALDMEAAALFTDIRGDVFFGQGVEKVEVLAAAIGFEGPFFAAVEAVDELLIQEADDDVFGRGGFDFCHWCLAL